MHVRDRIKELRRVRGSELRPHPRNWRTHPDSQRNALQGVLAEIGYANALVARELDDGSLQLIDGHLRAETTPDAIVPVLVLDVDEAEASKLLVTLDPLAGMAETAPEVLASLLHEVHTDNDAVRALFDSLAAGNDKDIPNVSPRAAGDDHPIPECYQVVVECHDEGDQQSVYERLTAEGYRCRVLTL